MTEHTPYIDFENLPTSTEGFLVTQFIESVTLRGRSQLVGVTGIVSGA